MLTDAVCRVKRKIIECTSDCKLLSLRSEDARHLQAEGESERSEKGESERARERQQEHKQWLRYRGG